MKVYLFAFVAGESGFILVIQSQKLVGTVSYGGRLDSSRVSCDARGLVNRDPISIDYWSQ